MRAARLSFAVIVGVGLAAGAFEHILGIGSGPRGMAPAAFAQTGGQPAGQPRPQIAQVKSPGEVLGEVKAEIDTVELEIIEKNGKITELETQIAKLRKGGARDRELEERLRRNERERDELLAKLKALDERQTAAVRRLIERPFQEPLRQPIVSTIFEFVETLSDFPLPRPDRSPSPLQGVRAEIDKVEWQILGKDQLIAEAETEITKLGKDRARKLRWEALLQGWKRERDVLMAKLKDLEETKTALFLGEILAPRPETPPTPPAATAGGQSPPTLFGGTPPPGYTARPGARTERDHGN